MKEKNYPEALKVLNIATTVSNTDADAYYWLSRCFEASGKKDLAIANYERAIALDSSLSEARDALKKIEMAN